MEQSSWAITEKKSLLISNPNEYIKIKVIRTGIPKIIFIPII